MVNISSGRGVSQREILDAIKKHYPNMKVEFQPARSVDADKIYLANDRLKTIWSNEMVTLEEGIEKYYQYLMAY